MPTASAIDLPFGIARNTSYADLRARFEWAQPETFNFATDVVDAWAGHADPLALVTATDEGDTAHLQFSGISERSQRLANVLLAHGIDKGDRVVVMMPRIGAWQIAVTACLRIGAIAIPCIEMLTPHDLAYRVTNAGATGVICRARHTGKFAQNCDTLAVKIALCDQPTDICLPGWIDFKPACEAAAAMAPAATIMAEDPVIMYYTSGSTGHPKGVLHAARALHAWRWSAVHWLDLQPGDRIWCTADTGWSKAGTSILFGPCSCGATAFFYDGPFDPDERLRLLAKHGITVYCAPATELTRVVDAYIATTPDNANDLSALRRTVSAGEAMNPAVADRWSDALGGTVSEAYGLTEALMIVQNIPSEPVKIGSMGRPAPGCEVAILDEAGHRLGIDEPGDIALLSPNPQLMLGYWRDPKRTDAVFRDGPDGRWFITGDRGTQDADGYIWYAGRADDIISSAGYRIGPLEVENALLAHPAVLECAVVGQPDPDRGEIVKAFIVLRQDYEPSDVLIGELQTHTKTMTAPYKYPRAIAFLDELPKTITGKIRRSELRDSKQQAAAGSDAKTNLPRPENR